MVKRTHKRLRHVQSATKCETGSMTVVALGLIAVFMAIAGMLMMFGHYAQLQQHIQDRIDLAALSAAHDLRNHADVQHACQVAQKLADDISVECQVAGRQVTLRGHLDAQWGMPEVVAQARAGPRHEIPAQLMP